VSIKNTEQPTCQIPTLPGAWWWQDGFSIGNPPRVIPVLEVADDEAPYLLAIMPALPTSLFVPVGETGGTWLAEVPPPGVCAALAEYDAARRAIVGLAPVGAWPVATVGEGPAALQRFVVARDSLNVALGLAQVAEQDGAA
jgi:hypothetical protein